MFTGTVKATEAMGWAGGQAASKDAGIASEMDGCVAWRYEVSRKGISESLGASGVTCTPYHD